MLSQQIETYKVYRQKTHSVQEKIRFKKKLVIFFHKILHDYFTFGTDIYLGSFLV